MELTLGSGAVMVASVERDGRKGLLLRPVETVTEIDTTDPEWLKEPQYVPTDNDVIVWIDNLAGARVLQDRVNILTLEHNRSQSVGCLILPYQSTKGGNKMNKDICYSTDCPMYSKLLPNGCGIEWQDAHIPLAARCKDFTGRDEVSFDPCAGCPSSSSEECNGLDSCTVSQMVKGAV